MAKIILNNGVINVDETYDDIKTKERKGDWIELTENVVELKHLQKYPRYKDLNLDCRILININNIQCIKP